VRYPKAYVPCMPQKQKGAPASKGIEMGEAEIIREGKDFLLVALGSMVAPAREAIEVLGKEGLRGTLVNARFAQPLDIDLLQRLSQKAPCIFSAEEGVINGGFGSAIAEALEKPVVRIGVPPVFVPGGSRDILLEHYGLTKEGLAATIKARMSAHG
jgi:deoxyxylulose-5-phosphate synthase